MQKQLAEWTPKKTKFLIFTLIGLYLLLFLPFWKPVLLGFLFASACAPLINLVRAKIHARRTRVAYAVVGLTLTFFIGLFALVTLQGYSQLYDAFQNPNTVGGLNDKIANARDQFIAWANQQSYLSSFNVQEQLDKAVTGITNAARGVLLVGAQGFLSQAPLILLELFIFIVAFGAFLVIEPRIWEQTSQALRLGEKGKAHFKRFEKICGLALGSVLLTGFVQSILVTVGAAIAGFDSLLMIFGVTFLCAMIPLLGAGIVPAILTIVGFVSGDMKTAIIMLVTAVIVGVADNILRAWLFSRAAKSNPAISLISLLGGLSLMGFAGLFVAPVIEQLVMTYAFSDEGEPKPGHVAASQEPVSPDRFVKDHTGDRTGRGEPGLAPS